MDRLWDWLKHTDAKSLFLASIGLFAIVLMVVVWQHFGCAAAGSAPNRTVRNVPWKGESSQPSAGISNLTAYMAGQLANDAAPPPNPFRPDISDLITGHGATNAVPRHRRGNASTSVFDGNTPPADVVHQLTYHGYFQRPDGTHAALFGDAADKSSRFLTPGAAMLNVTLLTADIRSASVRRADGSTTNLPIGGSITP